MKEKGTVAGVATGAGLGMILYMSLMAFLFKKFKKRKALELPPSDSESNLGNQSPVQSNGSGGRPQISQPVNTFNSLGWAP